MQHILVLLLCLFVAATNAEYGWRPKQEYRFYLEGRTVAGIPSLKHQYSGIHFMGSLRVQAQSAEILMMKLQNMTFTKIHTHLPRGWWQPLPQSEEMYQEFPISSSPFIARLDKGTVDRLVVSGNLDAWEVNFIQAVVGHLQLDVSSNHGRTLSSGNKNNRASSRSDSEADVFTVMENSVVGRCEVLYEITTKTKSEMMVAFPNWMTFCGKNRDFLEITKTYNYSHCEYLAESHFGLPNTMPCSPSGNECGSFWSRSAMSHSIGCGDRRDMILLNTISSSRVLVALRMQPEDLSRSRPNSQTSVGTSLNLTLLSAHSYDSRKRFGQPSNPVNIDGLRYIHSTTSHQHGDEQEAPDNTDSNESKSSTGFTTGSSEEESRRVHHHGRKGRMRRPTPTASPEMGNISPESASNEHSMENKRPWGQSKDDDMNKPPLMPFSAFSLSHREGEARACLVQQLKEVVSDIANDMDVPKSIPEKMTLEKIQIAVQMCQTMKYSELLRSVASIMNTDARETRILLTERKILRDVVIMCGTNPAFRIIKAWLEQRKIRGEDAAEMIAALPSYILSPSPSLIQQFYELVRNSAGSDDQQVRIASVLAFSHLLRVACINKAARKARYPEPYQPCRTENATQYLVYLGSQMRADPTLRGVYMTAIGNTGANAALPVLLSVARDSSISPYQRASAILSTRYIVFRDPKSTRNMLLSFYHSSKYPTAVRIAALSLLFYTRPPLMVWQRIAVSTWYETNAAINAYVWSTLNNLATAQDPLYKIMTERAIAVLPLARPVPLGAHRSYNLVRTAVSSGLHEVVLEQLSWTADLSAANIYYRQTQRLGGYSRLHFEGDFWIADADGFLQSFADILKQSQKVEKVRPSISQLSRSTHWIRETLKIAAREQPRIEGHLGFKLGALHERKFPFDHKIASNLEKAGRHLLEQFRTSKPLLYQKIGESGFWMGTPNELGFPMTFKLSVPWTIRAKAEINGSNDTNNIISADVGLLYTSQLIAELSIFTPYDCIQYVAGAQSHTFMQMPPMRFLAHWNRKALKMSEISVSSLTSNEQSLIFSQTSQPYTSQHDVISLIPISVSKTTMTVSVAPKIKSEMLQGTPMTLQYSSEAPNHRWSPEPHWVLNYPALWPGLESASLKLYADRPLPVNLTFTLGRATAENGEIIITSDYNSSDSSRPQTTTPSSTSITSTTTMKPVTVTSPNTYSETSTFETWDSDSWKSTTPFNSDEIRVHYSENTSMEELLTTNVTILSSVVEDPSGTFNASSINLLNLEVNKTMHVHLLHQVLSQMNNGRAYVVGVAIALNHSTIPRYHAYWTLGAGRAKRFHRAGLFVVDDVSKWQMGITSILQTPQVPALDLRSILNANLTSHLFVDYKYAANSSYDLISIKGSMMRTEAQTSYAQNNSMTLECLENKLNVQPECRRMAFEAGYLDRYNLTITYNDNAQQYGTSVQHYFNMMKHSMFPYMAEDMTVMSNEMPKNRVKVVAELYPESQTAALWMRTPRVEAELNGMPVNSLIMQTLRINPIVGFLPRFQDPSFCSVESNRVLTFDGSRYLYRLNSCWHVLAKDCSGQSRVVVLARNTSSNVEIEVNLDNHKIIRLRPNGEASVNDVKVDLRYDQLAEAFDQAGTRLIELMCTTDETLQLRLPAHGMTVLFGNNTILIQAQASMRGRLCGMCGDYDGEIEGDFRGPGGNVILPPRDFARSYALPGSCKMKD